jgi:hypothetical protein
MKSSKLWEEESEPAKTLASATEGLRLCVIGEWRNQNWKAETPEEAGDCRVQLALSGHLRLPFHWAAEHQKLGDSSCVHVYLCLVAALVH